MTVKYFLLLGRRDFKFGRNKRITPLFQCNKSEIVKKNLMAFGNLLLQIHLTNYNRTWQKASLGTSIE